MCKLLLTGQNLGRVFNFRSGHLHAATFLVLSVKLPNLQLKTRPKQLLGSLPLVIAIPDLGCKQLSKKRVVVQNKLNLLLKIIFSHEYYDYSQLITIQYNQYKWKLFTKDN
jgi:hypothetical protein